MIPTQVLTSSNKFQEIKCIKKTFFDLAAGTFEIGFTVSCGFSLGYHDCVTMLQTRFVLPIQNLMIRRESITTFLRMKMASATCFRVVSAGISGSLLELTDFTIHIFRKMCKKTDSWLPYIGLLDLSSKT